MTALALSSPQGAKASNLAFALGSLPDQRRRDALVFYGFCRVIDDIADDPGISETQRRDLLAQWKSALTQREALPAELNEVIDRYAIDPELLHEIILGVEADIAFQQPRTFEDLKAYCWKVASAVGLVSIQIFGCHESTSRIYAEELGYALQITNILRDVGEDASQGRIYLPVEDLAKFNVSSQSLLAGKPDGDFAGLMAFEAARARRFFLSARKHLTPCDTNALLSAEIMREIYETLLAKMERDRFRVFQGRYKLSKLRKLLIFARRRLGAIARPADA